MVLVVNQRDPIIDHVGFQPIEHLDAKLISRLKGFGEGLNISVIGDRNGRLSPLVCPLS